VLCNNLNKNLESCWGFSSQNFSIQTITFHRSQNTTAQNTFLQNYKTHENSPKWKKACIKQGSTATYSLIWRRKWTMIPSRTSSQQNSRLKWEMPLPTRKTLVGATVVCSVILPEWMAAYILDDGYIQTHSWNMEWIGITNSDYNTKFLRDLSANKSLSVSLLW